MPLPTINIKIKTNLFGYSDTGNLTYDYKPFRNLNKNGLTDLRLNALNSEIAIDKPIEMDIEAAYDGSVNIIFTDRKNPPKLINSRFALTSSTTFKITDREGAIDTNIYTEENFVNESSLIKRIRHIPKLEYLGLGDGGKMSVGNYTFYFKYADADGNMTDFVSESGKVICHIGTIDTPSSIRGGQMEENSEKIINFKLSNIDQAYQYIIVYYTKSSGDGVSEIIQSYFIEDKFKIIGESTSISITGYENHLKIEDSEINLRYALFNSVNTITRAQNMTFVGGIDNNYEEFSELEKLSLLITPKIYREEDIGLLDKLYKDISASQNKYEYYNTKNIYYRLGYWDEEIYRFGIVYILNDYSLSPVFNIRGILELEDTTNFGTISTSDIINEDYSIGQTTHNSKGTVRIISSDPLITETSTIKPIGIEFIIDESARTELKKISKGFFIVRQQRIPTILTQGVAIGTSKKSYFPMLKTDYQRYSFESFLNLSGGKVKLSNSFQSIDQTNILNNALLCPEVSLRTKLFNAYFNSTEYILNPTKYKIGIFNKYDSIYSSNLTTNSSRQNTNTKLTIVEPGTSLIGDGTNKFTGRAGDENIAWKHLDPIYGDIDNIDIGTPVSDSILSQSVLKARGEFNTYVGTDKGLTFGQYYNIYQNGYSTDNIENYFKLRYNDSSPYMAITDRIGWDEDTRIIGYRGDCYISTYAHRMNWNFIDPESPTNTIIVDPYTWYKNYKVKSVNVKMNAEGISSENNSELMSGATDYTYKRVLSSFTYKISNLNTNDLDPGTNLGDAKILTSQDKWFKKYSESNGLFGSEKIDRVDVNSVNIGHWAVFKICSNINLAMRDVDFTNPAEESLYNKKRSFYPLQSAQNINKLPESNVINLGISKTLGNKYYFEIPEVPFIKTNFTNRVHYSNILIDSVFQNGNRVFESKNFQDYTMEYGALVKLVEWYSTIIAVMEHGILMIPVNERALMTNVSGENVYINTDNVLPKNPKVLSNTFGSLWPDSIIKTSRYIYGIDTVAKKIWRTNGENFELISDLKIQKFLNDKINLSSGDNFSNIGSDFVKTHYNAFKFDIIFTFKKGNIEWSLCWNEILEKWITQYTWFPEFSENINNIFYTFANEGLHQNKGNILFKHGFAGNEEELGEIKPTYWYDTQYPFEFEFVVVGVQGIQKIFDNLKIISNSTEPDSFYYEVIGEGFAWNKDKSKIYGFTEDSEFETYLQDNLSTTLKLPYIITQPFDDITDPDYFYRNRNENLSVPFDMSILRDLTIRENNKTKEKLIVIYQKGADIKQVGRMKGNMQYLEDSWDVQIQPICFKYAYLKNGVLTKSNVNEMKIRDKYIKIRVKYKGDKYAIINALKTMFTLSYA